MTRLLVVCLGGAVGSGARYLLSTWVTRAMPSTFPAGTLAVNVIGSFFIALIMQISLSSEAISPMWRLGLTTGVLGGFTTYSTFNYETTELIRDGATGLAFANVAATLAGCLMFGFLGLLAGKWLTGR